MRKAGWEAGLPTSTVCMAVDAGECSELFLATLLRDWLQRDMRLE